MLASFVMQSTFLDGEKQPRQKEEGPLKIHIELAQLYKNTSASYLSKKINTSIAKWRK
jgi:hypothetical protein